MTKVAFQPPSNGYLGSISSSDYRSNIEKQVRKSVVEQQYTYINVFSETKAAR